MSCFVMDPHTIKRLAEFLTYCFSAPEYGTVTTRMQIAGAARHAVSLASHTSAAPYSLPVAWTDNHPVTPSDMAARLYAINDAAVAYNYHTEALDYHTCEAMFMGYDYDEWPHLTVDYLGRMLKTLQCFMYQCDEYEGKPQFMIVLQAVEEAIKDHLVSECCQSYKNAKWGE